MKLEIDNKVALITGASKGIGKAIALSLAAEGCIVYLLSRNKDSLEIARSEILGETGVSASVLVGDIADVDFCERAIEQIKEKEGRLDILVNNCSGPSMGGFLEMSKENWDSAYSSNLYSFINYSSKAAELMKENKWGRIINITSFLAKEPTPSMVLSATMRAGVSAFSKAISQELAEYGVTVNTICPSAVLTDRMVELTNLAAEREKLSYDEILNRAEESIPAKRFSTPNEIADLAVFLASDRAGYITGSSHMIDGGLSKSIF